MGQLQRLYIQVISEFRKYDFNMKDFVLGFDKDTTGSRHMYVAKLTKFQ